VARIAAPVVFLIAVIVFLGIVVQSGVVTGSSEPTPTPAAKSTKSTSGIKKYVVQSGDSWSSIAAQFNTSITDLQALNPELSSTTLVVGVKIVVPKQ
jgi:LysM repeat protein